MHERKGGGQVLVATRKIVVDIKSLHSRDGVIRLALNTKGGGKKINEQGNYSSHTQPYRHTRQVSVQLRVSGSRRKDIMSTSAGLEYWERI